MKRLKDKRTKGQTVIYKTLHKNVRIYNGFEMYSPLLICFIIKNSDSIHTNSFQFYILCNYFYSLASIFVISTKRSDPWVLEFVVSGTIGNNQWENYVVGFYFLRFA